MSNKFIVGLLTLVVLTSSVYVFMDENVKLDVQPTKTIFSVWENDSFVVSAVEYMYLYDGSAKMRAKNRIVTYSIDGEIIILNRIANYKDNISTVQTYKFNSSINEVELFPISETSKCFNCEGKIVHFEYRDILYDGETKEIVSPFSFGRKMTLTWDDGYYYAKVFQQKVASDKIIVKYRPLTNDETYNISFVAWHGESDLKNLSKKTLIQLWEHFCDIEDE